MGDTHEKVQLIWDTGSDWLVVGAAGECYTCDTTPYNYTKSASFRPSTESDTTYLQYGSG